MERYKASIYDRHMAYDLDQVHVSYIRLNWDISLSWIFPWCGKEPHISADFFLYEANYWFHETNAEMSWYRDLTPSLLFLKFKWPVSSIEPLRWSMDSMSKLCRNNTPFPPFRHLIFRQSLIISSWGNPPWHHLWMPSFDIPRPGWKVVVQRM